MPIDLIIIEDEIKMGKKYRNALALNDVLDYVALVKSVEDAIDYISGNPPPNIFWVDIHLGTNEYEGIEILKHIMKRCPEALVIVYTAYSVEKKCRDIGLPNLHYFEKNTSTLEDDFTQIRKLIISYIDGLKKKSSNSFITYYAQIAHIEKKGKTGWAKLICHYENQEIERLFHIDPVRAALGKDLSINAWIKVTIMENGPEIKIVFEKAREIPHIARQEPGSDISDDDFMNSKLWKQSSNKD